MATPNQDEAVHASSFDIARRGSHVVCKIYAAPARSGGMNDYKRYAAEAFSHANTDGQTHVGQARGQIAIGLAGKELAVCESTL